MKSHKSGIVLLAGLAIALTLQGCEGCKKHTDQPVNSAQTSAANEPQAPKPTRILSKLPDYFNAWYGEKDQDTLLMKYSHQYSAAYQSVSEKTNSISDPQLRATAISDAWSQYDDKTRASWLTEARANFKQHQSELLSGNADKLFEIGRIGFVQRNFDNFGGMVVGNEMGDNVCYPESRDGFAWIKNKDGDRLVEMCLGPTSIILSPVAIKLSIASLDDIRKRFDSHSSADVQACVDALYARNRDVVEKEIADSGLPRDQAMAQAMEEGRQSCLPQVRENLRVLAQGDLLHKQITSVFIMDYQTEDVLAEIPSTDVVPLAGEFRWETPTETGICQDEGFIGRHCK